MNNAISGTCCAELAYASQAPLFRRYSRPASFHHHVGTDEVESLTVGDELASHVVSLAIHVELNETEQQLLVQILQYALDS